MIAYIEPENEPGNDLCKSCGQYAVNFGICDYCGQINDLEELENGDDSELYGRRESNGL